MQRSFKEDGPIIETGTWVIAIGYCGCQSIFAAYGTENLLSFVLQFYCIKGLKIELFMFG